MRRREMDLSGSQTLEYLKPREHGKKTKPAFNYSQDSAGSRPGFPIAKPDASWQVSSRQNSISQPITHVSCQNHRSRTSQSDHLNHSLDSLDTILAISLESSSSIDEQSNSLPCWKQLTSNPGPRSQQVSVYSRFSSVLSSGSYTPDSQFFSWGSTSSVASKPFPVMGIYSDYIKSTHCLTPPRPPKRKDTELLLDEEKGWSCRKRGCTRSKVDCIHTSEIIELEHHTLMAQTTGAGSLLSQTKTAKPQHAGSPSRIVYLGLKP